MTTFLAAVISLALRGLEVVAASHEAVLGDAVRERRFFGIRKAGDITPIANWSRSQIGG